MAYRILICLLLIMQISFCPLYAAKKAMVKQNKPTLMDVYAQSVGQSKNDMRQFIEDKLIEQQTYGYVKPYIPVVQQPIVRKVWIPDHKSPEDADILIAGHWVYVMVQGPKWFIDTQSSYEEDQVKVPMEAMHGS